jgi:hypothetical protein
VSLQDQRAGEKALETLLEALDLEPAGNKILEELGPLLFPGGWSGGRTSMKAAIREAARDAFKDGALHG